MDDEDQARQQRAEQMSDFYRGCIIVERLAAWAYVVANQHVVLEHLASFERAYEEFVKLHAAGKVGAGGVDFSEENLERVKRIGRLLQPGLDSDEARQAAQELCALTERCLKALKQSEASPVAAPG